MKRWVRAAAEVLTDEQGKWESPPLPKTDQKVSLQIFHPEYLTSRPRRSLLKASRSPDELDTDSKPLKVRAERFILSGRVENWLGIPVNDATVDVYFRSGGKDVGQRRLVTDNAGRFLMRSTKVQVVLVVRAKGYGAMMMEQQVGVGERPMLVKLEPARMLQGKVVGPDGEGVADALVRIMLQYKNITPLLAEVRTDKDGVFRWDDAPQKVFVTISKPGYKPASEKMTADEISAPVKLEKALPVKAKPTKPRQRRKGYDPSRIFRRLS